MASERLGDATIEALSGACRLAEETSDRFLNTALPDLTMGGWGAASTGMPGRRERVATAALQGLLSAAAHPAFRVPETMSWEEMAYFFAERSVQFADALCDRLGRVEAEGQELLNKPVGILNLSVRPTNCLRYLGISTIGDLIRHSAAELREQRGFGPCCLYEVREKLSRLGLALREDPLHEIPTV